MDTCSFEGESARVWDLPFTVPPQLEARADLGAVELLPVEAGGSPRLEVEGDGADQVEVRVDRDGEVVRVTVVHFGGRFGRPAHARTRVRLLLPPGLQGRVRVDAGTLTAGDLGSVRLDLVTHTGRLLIRGLSGQVRGRTETGALEARGLGPGEFDLGTAVGRATLEDVHGTIRLRSETGKVIGTGLSGLLDVRTSVGSVQLGISGLEAGEHRVRTSAGSVRLALEPGLEVAISTRTGLGAVRIAYPQRADAAARLSVATDLGAIRVESSDATAPTPNSHRVQVVVSDVSRAAAAAAAEAVGYIFTTPPHPARPAPPSPPAPPAPPSPPAPSGAGAPPASEPVAPAAGPDPEVARILALVAEGRLSAKEANDLLRALESA